MPSFKEDVIAFALAFGADNAPVVMTMAQVPWVSAAQRDQFIVDARPFVMGNENGI